MTSKNEISVIEYVGFFALLNAALMLFFNVLAHGFDIDLGSGANIAMLMGASIATSICNNQQKSAEQDRKKQVDIRLPVIISRHIGRWRCDIDFRCIRPTRDY